MTERMRVDEVDSSTRDRIITDGIVAANEAARMRRATQAAFRQGGLPQGYGEVEGFMDRFNPTRVTPGHSFEGNRSAQRAWEEQQKKEAKP